jgi:hypothetical protein
MTEVPEGSTKVPLRTFVEENHKLLSVLGVFTALAVFARGLPLSGMGQLLSFLFMTLTILLWLELMSQYPVPASTRLMWFENLVTFSVMVTAGYWLLDYNAMMGSKGIAFLVAFTMIWLGSLPFKFVYARLKLPAWARSKAARWGLFIAVMLLFAVPSLVFGFWLGNRIGPPISKGISLVRAELAHKSEIRPGGSKPDATPAAGSSRPDSVHLGDRPDSVKPALRGSIPRAADSTHVIGSPTRGISPPVHQAASDGTVPWLKVEDFVAAVLTLANIVLLPFLLNPIRTLREVRDSMLNYRFSQPDENASGHERNEFNHLRAGEVQRLHHLFDRHSKAFNEFSTIRTALLIVLTPPALLAALSIANYLHPPRWTPAPLPIVALFLILAEVIALLTVQRLYAVPPKVLQTIRFLVQEVNMNIHALMDVMSLSVILEATRDFPKVADRGHLLIRTDLLVFGYRFLYIAYDDANRVYLLYYGPVQLGKQVTRLQLTPRANRARDEAYVVALDERRFLLDRPRELSVRLFVFASPFPRETAHPLYSEGRDRFNSDDGTSLVFTKIGGNFDISSRHEYQGMTFRGEGTRIEGLQTNSRAEEIVRLVIQRHGQAIGKTTRIVRIFDPAGFDV